MLFEFDWVFDLRYVCVFDVNANKFLCMAAMPILKGDDGNTNKEASVVYAQENISNTTPFNTNISEEIIDIDVLDRCYPQ